MFSPTYDLLVCRQVYINTSHFCESGDESQSLFYLFLFEFCMYICGTDSTIFGRLTMKTDLYQQQ